MNIETLSTGDEVANGDIVDTNSSETSRALFQMGHVTSRHTVLPDQRELLVAEVRAISARADLCVCTGGLGPTLDDLTAEVVSEVSGQRLEIHQDSLERMKARFEKAGLRFSSNNSRSARIPIGAEVKPNEVGTAPGFKIKIGKCIFFFLPGVPAEFREYLNHWVLPWVKEQPRKVYHSLIQLKTLGWSESHLAEKLEDLPKKFPGLILGYRAHIPEVWIKLSYKAFSQTEADQKLAPIEDEVRKRIGNSIFGKNQEELALCVHELLISQKKTLALAESCTGGRVSQTLTALSGSSQYYLGGIVSYSNESKNNLLGVNEKTLLEKGAVSPECAVEMAEGAQRKFNSDYALSVTGVAGPQGGTELKPVGLVYLALAERNGLTEVIEKKFRGNRERIQKTATATVLEILRRRLQGLPRLKNGLG